MIRFLLTAVFLIAGVIVCAIGVRGVFKFKYAANRMHAAAINDTLGIGLCMIGLAISAPDGWTAAKLLLVLLFFWISAPASSHLLCRLEIETNEEREQYMTVHPAEQKVENPDQLTDNEAEDLDGTGVQTDDIGDHDMEKEAEA